MMHLPSSMQYIPDKCDQIVIFFFCYFLYSNFFLLENW